MNNLIPTKNGQNPANGLDNKKTFVVIFLFDTLEIINVVENYSQADEITSDLFRSKSIDARFTDLSFFDESINPKNIIGMKLNNFQHFVDNNKHHLI